MRDLSHVVPFVSKAEMKRMVAREHNRAYLAGESTKKEDLVSFTKQVVQDFANTFQETPKK